MTVNANWTMNWTMIQHCCNWPTTEEWPLQNGAAVVVVVVVGVHMRYECPTIVAAAALKRDDASDVWRKIVADMELGRNIEKPNPSRTVAAAACHGIVVTSFRGGDDEDAVASAWSVDVNGGRSGAVQAVATSRHRRHKLECPSSTVNLCRCCWPNR